jgi:hypothetical protein
MRTLLIGGERIAYGRLGLLRFGKLLVEGLASLVLDLLGLLLSDHLFALFPITPSGQQTTNERHMRLCACGGGA